MKKTRDQRRAETKRVIEKRLKEIKALPSCTSPGSNGKSYYDCCAAKPHKYHKRHPLDCGKPRCPVCHGEKVYGKGKNRRPAQERRCAGLDNKDPE